MVRERPGDQKTRKAAPEPRVPRRGTRVRAESKLSTAAATGSSGKRTLVARCQKGPGKGWRSRGSVSITKAGSPAPALATSHLA